MRENIENIFLDVSFRQQGTHFNIVCRYTHSKLRFNEGEL